TRLGPQGERAADRDRRGAGGASRRQPEGDLRLRHRGGHLAGRRAGGGRRAHRRRRRRRRRGGAPALRRDHRHPVRDPAGSGGLADRGPVTARRLAGALVVFYILVQAFQALVYAILPEPHTAAEELAQGPLPLNLARAALLFVSFFALMYVFLVVCLENLERSRAASGFAFAGLFVFCLLELGLRAVELFWGYLGRPTVERFATFQAIQGALYVPLMGAQALASATLAFAFAPPGRRWNRILRAAFGLNALRLAARLAGAIFGIGALDVISGGLYFPLVLLVFGPIAAWLWANP